MTLDQQFWEEVQGLLKTTQPVVPKFRLYYNDQNKPIVYTMEELEGNYIEITREAYLEAAMNVRVQDGKLVKIDSTPAFKKLIPSDHGTPCDPNNVAVVVELDQPHILWSINDTN